jgi:hypothetical protein
MATFYSDMFSEPKRSNRFLFYLNNIEVYEIKSVDKPKFSVATVEHKFGQHRWRWPSSVTWDDVSVTLIDATGLDGKGSALSKLVNSIVAAGYLPPTSFENATTFMSKEKFVKAIGQPKIVQTEADGQTVLEEWVLHNAFITNASFGTLSYDGDEIVSISLTLSYDYATLNGTNPASTLK